MNITLLVVIFSFLGVTLYLRDNKSHSKAKATMTIPSKHSKEQQKCCWQRESLKLMNNEGSKSLVKTKSRPSLKNKSNHTLKYPWHDELQNSVKQDAETSYFAPSQCKGPLDDLMSKIVGERWIPFEEDELAYNNPNNTSCDIHHVNKSKMHHTNCDLELKGLKESLSSYSISSLKQV